MRSGVMPPTGRIGRSGGSTAFIAFRTVGRVRLGREQLQPVGAGMDRGERLGRRGEAGQRHHAGCLRRADHFGIGMGHDDQAAAGRIDVVDLGRGQHRAGADQRQIAELVGQARDAGE
jgi:hypothetical protein